MGGGKDGTRNNCGNRRRSRLSLSPGLTVLAANYGSVSIAERLAQALSRSWSFSR